MSASIGTVIVLAERAAVMARQARENSEDAETICRGVVKREARLMEELRSANENIAELRALIRDLHRRVEVIENTGAGIELGPPLDLDALDDADQGCALSVVLDADSEYWAAESDALGSALGRLDEEIRRERNKYGEINCYELAGSLGRKLSMSEHEDLAATVRTRLLDDPAWEVIEDSPGGESTWRYDDAGAVADEIAHLGELAADCSADWRYKVGHALYLKAKRARGVNHAMRYYGKYSTPPGYDARPVGRVSRGPRQREYAAAGVAG